MAGTVSTGAGTVACQQVRKKRKLDSGDVGSKIAQEDISMWISTAEKSETLSFVWDVRDIKDFLKEEIESHDFKDPQKTRQLLWKFKIVPRFGYLTPQLRVGIQLNNQWPEGQAQVVRGVYQLNILDSNWTILSATKSATPINFTPQVMHWNIVFPTSEIGRYLIEDNFLRIHVELVIETGLDHAQIYP